jgi:hypothetical protein
MFDLNYFNTMQILFKPQVREKQLREFHSPLFT